MPEKLPSFRTRLPGADKKLALVRRRPNCPAEVQSAFAADSLWRNARSCPRSHVGPDRLAEAGGRRAITFAERQRERARFVLQLKPLQSLASPVAEQRY